ncbi:MAG TPA: YIP1 family protein [Vicinamibacterales bacterium]|nr:YIP1 family protein [Vicinamibacterales bacterium]
MTNTSVGSSGADASTAPLSLLSRLIGVITAPKATFQAIVAQPRWLGMLVLLCVLSAALVGGFLLTSVGQEAWLDAARQGGPFGREVTDQQLEGMRRIAPFVGYGTMLGIVCFVPILYLVVSAVLFAVFNAGMGGNATFKQLITVVVHSGVIGLLGQLFTVPMNYARGVMTSATNLAVLVPGIAETSFIGRLLGAIDIFLIWQLIVLAIGLAVLYRRRTQPIATTLFVIYGIIALLIATVRSSFGGSN